MTAATTEEGPQRTARALHERSLGVTVEFDVPARMRDGVTLRANVYRPDGSGPWPTLLTRTPYCKDGVPSISWPGLDPVQAARRGFMVVVQDTRGRFASDGDWDPFRFEAQDGYETVEWAARLPGSSGRVAMYGGSYHGNTQWLAAFERPPSLAAISPTMTWSEPMNGVFARGGAVELGLGLMWALSMGQDYLERLGLREVERRGRVEALMDEWDRLDEDGYWELPVNLGTVLKRNGVPDIGAIRTLHSPEVTGLCRVDGSHEQVEVPTFHTAGWYDLFLQGTLDNYQAMAASGHENRLIVGPWTHLAFADPIGQRGFGIRASRDGVAVHAPHGDWNALQLAWFYNQLISDTHQLIPDAELELPAKPVRIFVMGRNEWRDESSWPPARAVEQRWFLRADGGLTTEGADTREADSEFLYDPGNPTPTVGGHVVMSPGYVAGPMDQAGIEARDDVLVFTSDPLPEDLEVTGRVRVLLHAESSAPSTDWVARLCDVHPDGRSFNLCDGIVRVGAAAGQGGPYEIDLWSTSNVFLRGHRLRVHVTSSCFPRWDRNLNTGKQYESRYEIARQRISHDPQRPSYIELPVIAPQTA